MNNPNRKLSELALTHGNPRTQSAEGGRLLADQIDCFGPLDGIVYNRRTKELVGGNMRSVRFRQCEDPEIVIDETYPKASKTGTVAMGHVMVDGERWTYREVDWPKDKHQAAVLAANNAGADNDFDAIAEFAADLSDDWKELTSIDFDALQPDPFDSEPDDEEAPKPKRKSATPSESYKRLPTTTTRPNQKP
jgi:hypothetical protein